MTVFEQIKSPLLYEQNQELRARFYSEILGPPQIDYLRLGLYYPNELHEDVWKTIQGASFNLGRFRYFKRDIRFDGARVATVTFSNGKSSRYGRKLLLNFTGEWFRRGFTAALAWEIRNLLEACLFHSSDAFLVPDWSTFTSVDRLDLAVELKKSDLSVSPADIRHLLPVLPGDMSWREFQDSIDGRTEYGSVARRPLKQRAKVPILRCYSKNEVAADGSFVAGETIRIEVEFPRVKCVDGTDSLSKCLEIAAGVFNALTPYHFVPEHQITPDLERYRDRLFVVPAPDFSTVSRPEDFTAHPYQGHAAFERSRQDSQGYTLLVDGMKSGITAEVLARFTRTRDGEILPDRQLEAFDSPGEKWQSVSFTWGDEVGQEERERIADMTASRSYSVEDLTAREPIELGRLRELLRVTHTYLAWFYPDADHEHWEKHEAAEIRAWAKDPTNWIKTFLTPIDFPATHRDWILHLDCQGSEYLEHSETGERYYPSSATFDRIRRTHQYRFSKKAATVYKLKSDPGQYVAPKHWVLTKREDGFQCLTHGETGEILYPDSPRFRELVRNYEYRLDDEAVSRLKEINEERNEEFLEAMEREQQLAAERLRSDLDDE